jgi:hypothetical protein
MKGEAVRIGLIALALLLFPAALIAQPTVGIYFGGGLGASYSPEQWEEFTGYVIIDNFPCFITAAEFAVVIPPGITLVTYDIPKGSLELGAPENGIAITYWPFLNGYEGSKLLCTFHFVANKGCGVPNGLQDVSLRVVPDENAVPDPGVLATCFPEHEIHFLTGLTSTICPTEIAVQGKSWGAIKSLYEK